MRGMSVTSPELTGSRDELTIHRVLADGGLRSVFQPLVRLDDHSLMGFEVLTRGPRGHRLESPMELLAEAEAHGLLFELDWAMRVHGLRTALALEPPQARTPLTWFFNAEPQTVAAPVPDDAWDVLDVARRLSVVIEMTERALTADPAGLLAVVDRIRSYGWGVALDDVGADPTSLALLPLLNPDVVKLDMRLIRQHRSRDISTITSAVRAHCEETGARSLAEGIETEEDVLVAQALGAEYGQGWFFGRPAEAPELPEVGSPLPFLERQTLRDDRTPFEVVADVKHTGLTEKRLLQPISRYLEEQVYTMRESLLFGCFQHAQFFTPHIAGRYAALAEHATFTAALATDLSVAPAPGVRGTDLHPTDPLALEWDVIVVGPHFAAALVARDLGDCGPDHLRRFEYVVTHDRDVVLQAARALVDRVTPDSGT